MYSEWCISRLYVLMNRVIELLICPTSSDVLLPLTFSSSTTFSRFYIVMSAHNSVPVREGQMHWRVSSLILHPWFEKFSLPNLLNFFFVDSTISWVLQRQGRPGSPRLDHRRISLDFWSRLYPSSVRQVTCFLHSSRNEGVGSFSLHWKSYWFLRSSGRHCWGIFVGFWRHQST